MLLANKPIQLKLLSQASSEVSAKLFSRRSVDSVSAPLPKCMLVILASVGALNVPQADAQYLLQPHPADKEDSLGPCAWTLRRLAVVCRLDDCAKPS